jgi:hypothetical protein
VNRRYQCEILRSAQDDEPANRKRIFQSQQRALRACKFDGVAELRPPFFRVACP